MRSHTVPNIAKLSITAAEPMSLAIPASGLAVGAAPVHDRLDGAVQDLDHQDLQHRVHQQGALDPGAAQTAARRG